MGSLESSTGGLGAAGDNLYSPVPIAPAGRSIHCTITAYPAWPPPGGPGPRRRHLWESLMTMIMIMMMTMMMMMMILGTGLGTRHLWEFHSQMPWETYRRTQWKGTPRTNFPIPQCDFENRLRSIPRHNPTASFPWGRRQWTQPSRMYHFRDQDCGSGHSSRIVLGLERGRYCDPEL